MYLPTLELANQHKCPRCGSTESLNVERQEVMTGENGKWVNKKGPLVAHCRTCGCNTILEAQP